jgi:hypothetical protein
VAADSLRIAEIGAGDGTLMLRVLRHVAPLKRMSLTFVDRQPVVSAATAARYSQLGCSLKVDEADVFAWFARQETMYDAIVANLFLHHFEAPQLVELFTQASRCTTSFIACEPRRARIPLAGSRMLGLIGCNDVTRHDAYLSVLAGFSDTELSQLWALGEGWQVHERRAGLLSHLFTASQTHPHPPDRSATLPMMGTGCLVELAGEFGCLLPLRGKVGMGVGLPG